MTEQIQRYGGKAMICGLDLRAAFNNIHHQYLSKLLERLNFNRRIRRTLDLLNHNMYSAVIVNGAKTKYFKLCKSIRLGDKASMTLFIIAIEPLANIIRRDKRMSPVISPNTRPKHVSQYCDDTSIISTKAEDIKRIKSHMKTFEKGTGSIFNDDKTEILLLGKWYNSDQQKLPRENLRVSTKILGVWFGENSMQLNREQILRKIEAALNFWRSIPLTFAGKRLIIMTKVVPQLLGQCIFSFVQASAKAQVSSFCLTKD
jgi:hypothetical protein